MAAPQYHPSITRKTFENSEKGIENGANIPNDSSGSDCILNGGAWESRIRNGQKSEKNTSLAQ